MRQFWSENILLLYYLSAIGFYIFGKVFYYIGVLPLYKSIKNIINFLIIYIEKKKIISRVKTYIQKKRSGIQKNISVGLTYIRNFKKKR